MNELKTDVIINRDALYALRELPGESVNCCVTSPPYYALRDYGLTMQIGCEDTPEQYIENSLVRRECCNCDNGHCILLDDGDECVCPQLISYSLLCKWFQIAVLPLDKLLYAELFQSGVV